MENDQRVLHALDRDLVWAGFRQMTPIALFVLAFGLAFGLAATQAGLGGATTVALSALAFAGAAQFAALDMWGPNMSLLTLLVAVLAINARHLLMGATLYPWLRELPPVKRYGVMALASDANWAMAMQAFSRRQPGFGILLGGGMALWVFWVAGTWLGLYFGSVISDPKAYGLDMVMGCFLLAMTLGGEKNLRMLLIWAVAAVSAILAYRYLPQNSHVVVGALAGGILGTVWGKPEEGR